MSAHLVIGAGNEGQAQAWDGTEGAQWASNPRFYDEAVRHHHAHLLDAAAITASDAVLDVGCGNGETTLDAARAATSGLALGVDLSSQMIEVARGLAERAAVANATFLHADAQVHPFDEGTFDVAISRFGSMFFADQDTAFANIARALRPGGRLILLSWQAPTANEWITAISGALTLGRPAPAPPPGAPGPFRHADPAEVTSILTRAGFRDVAATAVSEPMSFGRDADEGYAVLSELMAWMLEGFGPADRTAALKALLTTLRDHETEDGVAFASGAWLYTATRG